MHRGLNIELGLLKQELKLDNAEEEVTRQLLPGKCVVNGFLVKGGNGMNIFTWLQTPTLPGAGLVKFG
jgi:hypothetical protein